jgi:isoquinoline 1-oxidoreductase beta subunit
MAEMNREPGRALSRREFVRVGAAAGGGLVVAFAWPAAAAGSGAPHPLEAGTRSPAEVGALPFEPNAFLRIGADGSVVLVAPRPEMGQGVRTALPMLVAEELEVEWEAVRIEQADAGERFERYAGHSMGQYVGGSASVWSSWEPLRRAGAVARTLLVAAAAGRLGVAPEECRARAGRVLHAFSGRSLAYGELASEAAELPVPDPTEVPLKDPSVFRIVGTARRNVDAPEIARGRMTFGLDVRVPGMLFASVERAPSFGARIRDVDSAAAHRVRGVVDIVEIDPEAWDGYPEGSPRPAAGVAVVADSTWAAIQGRKALRIRWTEGTGRSASTEEFWSQCERRVRAVPERVMRRDGDAAGMLAKADAIIEAEYRVPFLAHAQIEPMSCTARVAEGRCELWAPTQNPTAARQAAAAVAGIDPAAVTLHFTRMGGAFGRRFYPDFVAEAVRVSKSVGRPVQVVWTREDDIRHGFYRPAGLHLLRASLGRDGLPEAWSHHLANAARYVYLGRDAEAGAGELYPGDFPAGHVPHFELAYSSVPSEIPRGQWRAIAYSSNVFVVESFLDELSRAAGTDPLTYRVALLDRRSADAAGDRRGATARLRRVLETAARSAGWSRPRPEGRGRGLACSYANGAFAAHIAEVSVDPEGRPVVHRVVSAVDPGRAVNPAGVRAQVEGSIVMGISTALGESITVSRGRVEQGNFDDYPLLRIDRAPEIEVHIVASEVRPDGMGEGALPPVAPAVANALFDAVGVRVRRLPIGRITPGE